MLKSYGTILLEPGRNPRWHVKDLAPHVAMAFKRLFPRAHKLDVEFFLTDSDDVRADLFWFCQRYPLETKHMGMLKAGDQAVKGRAAKRGEILMPEWTPGPLKGIRAGEAPYHYQAQAARIALNQGGLLLADDVGLGKTNSALTAIAMGAPLPAAIVVQPHLDKQWRNRIMEFTDFDCHIIAKSTPYALPKADIYIFRYSIVGGWIDFIKNGYFKSVFYDEIQELRTGTSTDKGRACSILSGRARFKMGLTATATYNYGDEIHDVMQFINPNLLGDRSEFNFEWCEAGGIVKDADALGEYLKDGGWMLRRTEDDPEVSQSMPKPNIIPIEVDWNSQDAADDQELMRSLAMRVMGGDFQASGSASRELNMRMRQMTGVGKARSVAAYVRMLLRDTEKLILTGWHREVYGIWLKALEEFRPAMYTGTESASAKQESLYRFTAGASRILILSNRSGAGIDGLQHHCRTTVIGEFDWSPQAHKQIIGRTRRPGQKHQVDVHFPYVNQGSDPVLMEVNAIKSDQARGIHDPGVMKIETETDRRHLRRLAQYVLDQQAVPAAPCAICGGPSTGKGLHIVPLSEAHEYPAGPEREALFGSDNIWFLCERHAAAVAA